MPVIIKNPFFSKKIKDATITPDKVLRGEIGYGNNNERIVGAHVCKKKSVSIKIAEGTTELDPNGMLLYHPYYSLSEIIQYDRRNEHAIEGTFIMVDDYYSTVAAMEPTFGGGTQEGTILKKVSVNVKNNSDMTFDISINGKTVHLYLAEFTGTGSVFFDARYNNSLSNYEITVSGNTSIKKNLEFVIIAKSGIITDIGVGVGYPLSKEEVTKVMSNYDIEFRASWI